MLVTNIAGQTTNPYAATSELAGTVLRMGGEPSGGKIPAAHPALIQVADIKSAADLAPVVRWIETPGVSKDMPIGPRVAKGLGLNGGVKIPGIGKEYERTDGTGTIYSFVIARVNGQRELILAKEKGDYLTVWRVVDGGLITIQFDGKGDVSRVPSERFLDLYDETAKFFLNQALGRTAN